jgi:hypothetical protein
MNQRLELSSEKRWTRMSVRSDLGIEQDAPWFGMLIPNSFSPGNPSALSQPSVPRSKQLAAWLCDLAWSIRNVQLGALSMFPLDTEMPTGFGPMGELNSLISHWHEQPTPDTLLAWMMATDGWFLIGDSPLNSALAEAAFALELPTVQITSGPANTQTLVHALHAQSIPYRRSNTRWDDAKLECLHSSLKVALDASYAVKQNSERPAHRAA